jgi:hypothetical protein
VAEHEPVALPVVPEERHEGGRRLSTEVTLVVTELDDARYRQPAGSGASRLVMASCASG